MLETGVQFPAEVKTFSSFSLFSMEGLVNFENKPLRTWGCQVKKQELF
jgi:hypothetical protein